MGILLKVIGPVITLEDVYYIVLLKAVILNITSINKTFNWSRIDEYKSRRWRRRIIVLTKPVRIGR